MSMLDFLDIAISVKKDAVEIYPRFKITTSDDLMIRGRDFYAIWVEERGLWSTDEQDVISLVDSELKKKANEYYEQFGVKPKVKYMWDADSGVIDKWHKYCQKQMRDHYHMLDETLIFQNSDTNKKDYASKRLNYALEIGDTPAYDTLMSTLYSEEERHKIEWAIGSIVTGDSKKIQKFIVLYGAAATGKSTVLNIIQMLFDGYYSVFDAKALGSNSNVFALESFKTNPLVAIQHDGDLSHIEDNTRLNSVVSHETMTVNEKFKSTYSNKFKCFLFMGTNRPVKITDGKSGLLRRLIDVSPSGNKIPITEYRKAMKRIEFELGFIASKCKAVYLKDPNAYDGYIPISMIGASNDFYNYVLNYYTDFEENDGVSLSEAWDEYRRYCEYAKVLYPASHRVFKEELKNYFNEFYDRFTKEDGTRVRSYYSGFKKDIFNDSPTITRKKEKGKASDEDLLKFDSTESIFDKIASNYPAQYADEQTGAPLQKWSKVKTCLKDLDTTRLHYVNIPETVYHIVVDFDLKDEAGNKSFELNLREASKWPRTYAELSKSGGGIHLHYIYSGDISKLSRIYSPDIEIKIFNGDASLRRKLSWCNNLPIASINSGLPLKGDKMINKKVFTTERGIRTSIKKCLNKETHGSTKPEMDFIKHILDEAYNSGVAYDVSDMFNDIFAFASNSTHNAKYCIDLTGDLKLKSEEASPAEEYSCESDELIFFDVEVYPNYFCIAWKPLNDSQATVKMRNPTPKEVRWFLNHLIIGFNCREYDNHILYAAGVLEYDNESLYKLSKKIIDSPKGSRGDGKFREAYNISYIDVYDMCTVKQSLKKWEVELGISHQELDFSWDEPIDEKYWDLVDEYCSNDVLATEAVFKHRQADYLARLIQVDIAKDLHGDVHVCCNDTTNTLSKRIIFGNERSPQNEFNWRDMSKPVPASKYEYYLEHFGDDYTFRVFDADGVPTYEDYIPGTELPDGYSILPFFPGYTFEKGVSTYLGETIGEGGRVYAEPGIWYRVWDGDVVSQHPHSIIAERLFGPRYTKIFSDLVAARVAIKHKDNKALKTLLNGVLKPYLNDESKMSDLAQALKIVINSIYGLTSASFINEFRDPRNVDNIVAKRGALFMTLLKREVQKRGFKVAHIKTDSIKIPNATDEIKDFVIKFGAEFGYQFETEATFERFCLVNNAVYIAKEKDSEWVAVGAQFAIPYVYKTLFSKEKIEFDDLTEVKAVKKGSIYIDLNESLPENEHEYVFVGRIGRFCPMKDGCGGGILYRVNDGSYYALSGTKGYRWLEAETVKNLKKEDGINIDYYNALVDDAIDTISQYGNIDVFINGVVPDINAEDIPPWFMQCGRENCEGCPNSMEGPLGHVCGFSS